MSVQRRFYLYLLIFFWFCNLLSFAQDSEIKLEVVQQIRNELIQDTTISQDAKNAIDKILNDCLNTIQIRENLDEKYNLLKQEIDNAEQTIKRNEEFISSSEKSLEIPTKELSIEQLNQLLSQKNSDYKQKEEEYESLLTEIENRNEYIKHLLAKSNDLKQQIHQLKNQLDTILTSDDATLSKKAKEMLIKAQISVAEKELEICSLELDHFEILTRLLTSKIEALRVDLQQTEKQITYLQNEINLKKQSILEENIQKAISTFQTLPHTQLFLTEELTRIAKENLSLAQSEQASKSIINKISQIKEYVKNKSQDLRIQKSKLEKLKQKSDTYSKTSGWAFTLKQEKNNLPNIRILKAKLTELNEELAQIENEYSNLISRRLQVTEIETKVNELISTTTVNLNEIEKKKIKSAINELFKTQRSILSNLIAEYESYMSLLTDAVVITSSLIQNTNEFNSYINENIIWIRSSYPSSQEIKGDFKKLYDYLKRSAVFYDKDFVPKTVLLSSICLLGIVVVLMIQKFINTQIGTLCLRLKTPFRYTLTQVSKLIYVLFVRILILPFWFLVISVIISHYLVSFPLSEVVAKSFRISSIPLLWFELLSVLFCTSSVSDLFITTGLSSLTTIYKPLSIFKWWAVIATFIIFLMSQFIPSSPLADIVFRLTFSLFLLSFSVLILYITLRLNKFVQQPLKVQETKVIRLTKNILLAIFFACLSLVVFNLIGYNYGTLELSKKLFYSLFVVTTIYVLFRLIRLVFRYYQWKITFQQSLLEQTTLRRNLTENIEKSTILEEESTTDPTQVILPQLDKVINYGTIVLGIACVIYIWSDIFPALSYLDRIKLWQVSVISEVVPIMGLSGASSTAESSTQATVLDEWVTLKNILQSILTLVVTIAIVKNLAIYLEILLLNRLNIQPGEKYAITTILKYIIFTIGLIIALSYIKITWNKVQWLVAALGVGFGFGLQEIVANFVSGLILLFERPLRIGDIVTIGDISGKVKALKMRSTTIVNWDNKELIVPNKDLLTQRLINWTRGEQKVRLCIPVGVSYNSDVNKVITILKEIGDTHPFVEHEPEPKAYFLQFGNSALEFELRVYSQPSYLLDLKHELHMAIFNRFKEEGIEIAYPQLDVHIKENEKNVVRQE